MVTILCRGRLLAALAITIGSIIAGWTPAAAATLTVGKAAPNADPVIPVNVGDKLGIFKKHGLDLTIVDFTGGSKMTQAMVAGKSIGSGFNIFGVPIARDAALVEAGGDLLLTAQAKIGVSYAGQLANSAHDHSVRGNFTWRF